MLLRMTGGGMWDGVEFDAALAPQVVHLSGIVVDDEGGDLPPSLRKTVLMSKLADQKYELDSFDGPNESIAVYRFAGRGGE
jgi:hypothetical protein